MHYLNYYLTHFLGSIDIYNLFDLQDDIVTRVSVAALEELRSEILETDWYNTYFWNLPSS